MKQNINDVNLDKNGNNNKKDEKKISGVVSALSIKNVL